MIFAKVDKDSVQYPYLTDKADYERGILPVLVKKPDTFRDELEVWLEPEFIINEDFVTVVLTKRDKTPEEIDLQITEKQEILDRELSDKATLKERFYEIIKDLTSDEKSQLIQLLKGA